MDELIKQLSEIKLSVQTEKEMSRADLEARTKALKSYSVGLDEVLKQAGLVEIKLKGDLNVLQAEISKAENQLSATKGEHSRILMGHSQEVKAVSEHLEGLKKAVSDHTIKSDHLSKVNDGLTEERRQLEEQNIALRGQNAALERRRSHADEDCISVEKRVNSLLEKETELNKSIEDKKKDFTRLSNDVVILEKRVKK